MYKSSSIDPLNEFGLETEHLSDDCWIVRNRAGEIIRTNDALNIRREFAREPLTRKLMVRIYGTWTKLDGGCIDSAGTLFYCRGDVEIQEHLNGTHIHTNRQTGVQIQTDHVNHRETMRQANGEMWKRQLDQAKETFEVWLDGSLTSRSTTFSEPHRLDAATPCGKQVLTGVARSEESFAGGQLIKERFTFCNPADGGKAVTLLIGSSGSFRPLRRVTALVTDFDRLSNAAVKTVYEFSNGNSLQVDETGVRYVFANAGQPIDFQPNDEPAAVFDSLSQLSAVSGPGAR